MPSLKLVCLESVPALRARADAWDDLWRRADVAAPTLRAELLAQWLEQFARGQPLRALVVTADGQFVAALPLVGLGHTRTSLFGRLPNGIWSSSGDLLLDPSADVGPALETLVGALGKLPWPGVCLDFVELASARWRALQLVLQQHGMPPSIHQQARVGQIEVDGSWQQYRQRWSRGHQKSLRRCERRLREAGACTLEICRDLTPDQVGARLLEGFEVEDRSWKGAAGTSVLRTRGMAPFFLRQAQQLARWGQLELVFLKLDGSPIAFEMGCVAKGVYFSHKVGYDQQFARCGPGRLLTRFQLEQYHADPERKLVDCMGELADAAACWVTRSYQIGRLLVGTGGRLGRLLTRAHADLWPKLRRVAARLRD